MVTRTDDTTVAVLHAVLRHELGHQSHTMVTDQRSISEQVRQIFYFFDSSTRPFVFITRRLQFARLLCCYRGRGEASGACAAIFYIIAFLVSKTWLNLQSSVELYGCFFLYGILAAIGIIFVYKCLPETEGKTLAEIEKNFAKKNVK